MDNDYAVYDTVKFLKCVWFFGPKYLTVDTTNAQDKECPEA